MREILSAQCLHQTSPPDPLRGRAFRVSEPTWRHRPLEDVLGAGNILGTVPQVDSHGPATSAIFSFDLQVCGPRSAGNVDRANIVRSAAAPRRYDRLARRRLGNSRLYEAYGGNEAALRNQVLDLPS